MIACNIALLSKYQGGMCQVSSLGQCKEVIDFEKHGSLRRLPLSTTLWQTVTTDREVQTEEEPEPSTALTTTVALNLTTTEKHGLHQFRKNGTRKDGVRKMA
ncbi:hypothetical protein CHS0354_018318 [Potamilus streckersoni]|uniref:Uncharacterized protein n=1 Tax=Potamilus streckersoni TaxID=2493646 RepID=A0AAE0TJS8_9BIVA|nr:hypothetical protein CHS0354_018318 [Potamilus streckersoni]